MEHYIVLFSCIFLQCLAPIFGDELLAVTAIVNHGDTIPHKFYSTDPYQNSTIWGKKLGQLSILGEQQTFALGKWLRRRYDTKTPLLTLHYNGSQIYTFSEDRDESLMSAETIMAGLYPPVGDEIWNEKIHWRPTPVHSEPLFIDHSVGRGAYCQKYNQDLAKVNSGRYLRTHNKEDKDLLKYLSKYTGDTFANINQIPELFDILTVEKNHNLVLPNWTHAVYPDALAKVVLELSIMRTKNPELTKLSIGPLLNKILLQFQYVSKNKKVIGKMDGDKRKFEIYVGNSTLIYDSLHALKVAPVGVVPFGAALIFELWNSPENNYVKVLYRPSPQINSNLQQLKINPCKSLRCPYDIFTSTLKNISVNDIEWEHLCQQ